MKFNSNIKAASIAEVVMSLTIISICFGIAMLSIVSTRESTLSFQEINDQTKIQNHIVKEILKGKKIELDFQSEFTDLAIDLKEDKSLIEKKYTLTTNSGKILFDRTNYIPIDEK